MEKLYEEEDEENDDQDTSSSGMGIRCEGRTLRALIDSWKTTKN